MSRCVTHRERASQVAAAILALKVAAEDMAPAARELVWTALVCASNDELARRRDVEAELDRAQRLQAALEVRNAELEGYLRDLVNIIGIEDLEGNLPARMVKRAQGVLLAFEDSKGERA